MSHFLHGKMHARVQPTLLLPFAGARFLCILQGGAVIRLISIFVITINARVSAPRYSHVCARSWSLCSYLMPADSTFVLHGTLGLRTACQVTNVLHWRQNVCSTLCTI